jgi:hypothetical protein
MSKVREAYARAATVSAGLLAAPAVAATWDRPSALAELTVSGLAGHLAQQIHSVPLVLAQPPADAAPISLDEHYDRVRWLGAALDDEANVAIRRTGEDVAAGGPDAVAARAAETAAALGDLLRAEPADRVVLLPWTGWPLTLDDLLVTRLMEIAVHCDDLAVSVGVPTPELPGPAMDAALALLCRLAARRHGPVPVLRALSRAERAPATIAAL